MLVKFTNASNDLKGNPLYINVEHITSVFEAPTDGGSLKTIIWGGPTGIGWEVEESLNEAFKLISAANSKTCGCK
jgi:hypothetical protein